MFLIFCVNYFIFYNDRSIEDGDLERDGFCLCKNVLDNGDIDVLKQLCFSKNYKKSKEIILNNPKKMKDFRIEKQNFINNLFIKFNNLIDVI
jgi:hypothetical protein